MFGNKIIIIKNRIIFRKIYVFKKISIIRIKKRRKKKRKIRMNIRINK